MRGDAQGFAGGADRPHLLPDGKSHDWSLVYDPAAVKGRGGVVVKLDGETVALNLGPDDRKVATRFDRFGLITTWIDGNAHRVYFDDLTYTCGQ